jgi:hypothetical protein
MASIKCTKKLADRAGIKLVGATEQSNLDWHASLFTLDRRFYVIFCEDVSRLSVLAGPVLKRDLQDLPQLLRDNLVRTLKSEAFSENSIEFAVSRLSDICIAKTDNRSVLGTINDNIWHTEIHAYHAGGVELAGLDYLAKHLNHMPIGPLKYKYAIEAFNRSVVRVA